MKKGFTLIELLMVISIIAIISTLAVNKVGGIREVSARKVSLANQIAVERAVESYLSGGGRLNRLDSLVYTQGGTTTPWPGSESGLGFHCEGTSTNYTPAITSGLYMGPIEPSATAAGFRDEYNAGLTPGLQAVLCPYGLSEKERKALGDRIGLYHVMGHNEYAGDPAEYGSYQEKACGDGSYVLSCDGRDPNGSGCIPISTTNTVGRDMALLAVNPIIEAGRAIYRACGQELLNVKRAGERYTQEDVIREVAQSGGPLIALGLGPRASIVGKAQAGLESAPYATYPARKYYGNYILLFRLKTVSNTIVPEFAGVLDPCGNTIGAARAVISSL